MNNKKFENEFRNAFLGNEQAPVDGFMYYEDKLGLERKPPLYKRRPFFVNAMMVCFFLIAIVGTNLTTYFMKKELDYYNGISKKVLVYLNDEYDIIFNQKVLYTKLLNNDFELYSLSSNDSKTYFLIKYNNLENINVELCINNSDVCLQFYNIKINNSSNQNFYYISDCVEVEVINISLLAKQITSDDILVKFYF